MSAALKCAQSANAGRGKGKARGRGVQGKGRDAPSTSGTSDAGRRGKGGSKSSRGHIPRRSGTATNVEVGNRKNIDFFLTFLFCSEPGHIAVRCKKKDE